MALTTAVVEKLFAPLLAGDGMAFFTTSVDDEVVWTIGTPENKTCLLSGRYEGKHATAIALSQLAPFFTPENPARTSLEKVLLVNDAETAIILLRTTGKATNGIELIDRACWVCRIVDGKIKSVDNYCDTGAINRVVQNA